MVDYHDPATVAQEFVSTVRLWHVVNGMFIWEFVTNLDFEWNVIRGHLPYRWSIWVYSVARLATIVAVALNILGSDTTTPINCRVWFTFAVLFSYLAFLASSLLIVLRVIAIWNKTKIIYAISMTIWTADVAILLYCLAQVQSTWSPEENTCLISQFDRTTPSAVGSLVANVALLLIMIFGLLRLETSHSFGMGRVLWNQSLIWLFLACVAEVPTTVFLLLDLNSSLDLMTTIPNMIIVTIAATRMHRDLVIFGSSNILHEIPRATGPAVPGPLVRPSEPIPLNRMEATVHAEYDTYGMPQMIRYAKADTQGRHKAHELILNGDEESGPKR